MVLEISISRKEDFFWAWLSPCSSAEQHGPASGLRLRTDLHWKAVVFGLKEGTFQSWSEKNNLKKAQHQHVRMLHCTSSQSLVDSNLFVAERPIERYGKGRLRKEGGPSSLQKRPLRSVDDCRAEKEKQEQKEEGSDCREPRLSSLVVVGRVGEGELQPVGFGQQYAHFLVAPVHCGKVLQQDHQTLLGKGKR